MSEAHDDEPLILDTPAGEDPQEAPEQHEETEGAEGEDALDVTFGDEAAPGEEGQQDSGLVKKLRGEIRERDQRLAALAKEAAPKPIEVGEKPTMADCYDADDPETEFEKRLDAWKGRKAEADGAATKAAEEAEANNAAWTAELADFGTKKAALRAPDFDAAEEEVVAGLTQIQQAIIIKAADNSAKVIYALGKHPAKLTELAKITDPIKFAVAISKLEGTIKVAPRRQAPEPEGTVKGSARLSPQADKALEKLETEALRTGDRSKVIAYKREQKAKARA